MVLQWFYLTWAGGRTALMTFSTAYMLDLGFSMTKITLIIGLQVAINLGMLLIMGRITDRFGARLPLILISGGIAVSMLLWVASAGGDWSR
ncbi:MAG: MFS transporter [Victivallales bacterium]